MNLLSDSEAESLINLADQIAGWREFDSKSLSDRRRFVKNTCWSSLPSFLLRLLHSEYVRDRYREEFNKIEHVGEKERQALVAALYIAHIGERPTTSLLSDVFELDIGGLLQRLAGSSGGLRLLRLRGHFVETVPAIGATNILKELVADKEIVSTVVESLRRLAEVGRIDHFRRHIFSQMMRYSIIRPVVGSDEWITRFFDNISKIEYMRRQVLFWLQWSIALREQGEFVDSENKLQQAYREAELYEKKRGTPFDRRQLDDVKAKFLVARATSTSLESPALFRDLKASCEIVARLLKTEGLTHHPFETLAAIAKLFSIKENVIDRKLKKSYKENNSRPRNFC